MSNTRYNVCYNTRYNELITRAYGMGWDGIAYQGRTDTLQSKTTLPCFLVSFFLPALKKGGQS